MIVKDVLKLAAVFLGRQDIVDYLNGQQSTVTASEISTLLRCYRFTEIEIATEYYPLVKSETVNTVNGSYSFSSLNETPYKIYEVTDINGNLSKCTVTATGIINGENKVIIKYSYIPDDTILTDTINFANTPVTDNVLALGTASEFLLTKSLYDEAVVFNKKYMDGLENVLRKTRRLKLKGRGWF